jgi:hypothetical protein
MNICYKVFSVKLGLALVHMRICKWIEAYHISIGHKGGEVFTIICDRKQSIPTALDHPTKQVKSIWSDLKTKKNPILQCLSLEEGRQKKHFIT